MLKQLLSICLLLLLSASSYGQDKNVQVPINSLNKQFEVIGELGVKLGKIITVRGLIVEGPFKGYDGGPNLLVQLINDSATQQPVQIPLSGIYGDDVEEREPHIKAGNTYQLRVYETGEFVGSPRGLYEETGVLAQTTGFYFRNQLIVIKGVKTAPVEWSPQLFTDRYALLSGTAKNEKDTAIIQAADWKLKLAGLRKWTDTEIGKLAEVYGKIIQTGTAGTYLVENGESRLVNLEDQLGKPVKLRGIAMNFFSDWWFNYRGTNIYVENMGSLPGITGKNHYKPIEITGILEQAELPDLAEIRMATNPPLKKQYIVRKASWTPLASLLSPEMHFEFE